MERIKPLDAVTLMPVDEVWRDRAQGVKGHSLPASFPLQTIEEITHLIEHSGQTPNGSDLEQVRKAIEFLTDPASRFDIRIDGWQSAPPGSPVDGTVYIVKGTGTGDWAGHDEEIASRVNGQWTFPPLKTGLLANGIFGGSRVIIQFDGTEWVVPLATETVPGILRIATQAEVDSGADVDAALTPDSVLKQLAGYAITSSAGSQYAPTGVHTFANTLSAGIFQFRDPQSAITPNGVVLHGLDAGVWGVSITAQSTVAVTGRIQASLEVNNAITHLASAYYSNSGAQATLGGYIKVPNGALVRPGINHSISGFQASLAISMGRLGE